MTFEEHSKAIAKAAVEFNKAIMAATAENFQVKTQVCGNSRELYNVVLSKGCGDV